MSSSVEDEHIEEWDETDLRELVGGEERTPVEESFYESYIIQSRTAVDNLYASNVLSCQKHMKEMSDLARQRKVKLSSLEREQKKLLHRMENLKEKQETHLQKRTITNDSRSKSAKGKQTEIADKSNRMHSRRGSLPPLTTNTEDSKDQTSKMVKGSDQLNIPANILSKSCNDLTSAGNKDSLKASNLVLPAIKPSRSHENLPGTPFITHISSKVHKYPLTSLGLLQSTESRDSKSSWDEKKIKTQISTKVKWVPRS